MKSLFTNAAATASGAALFVLGCALAGIGLSVFALLVFFGLAAMGVAFLASLFLGRSDATLAEDARPQSHAAQ